MSCCPNVRRRPAAPASNRLCRLNGGLGPKWSNVGLMQADGYATLHFGEAGPFSGYLYIFRTRLGTVIRILQYDDSGVLAGE
jgi:hypothetical protein